MQDRTKTRIALDIYDLAHFGVYDFSKHEWRLIIRRGKEETEKEDDRAWHRWITSARALWGLHVYYDSMSHGGLRVRAHITRELYSRANEFLDRRASKQESETEEVVANYQNLGNLAAVSRALGIDNSKVRRSLVQTFEPHTWPGECPWSN
jgi:hypothetical protein